MQEYLLKNVITNLVAFLAVPMTAKKEKKTINALLKKLQEINNKELHDLDKDIEAIHVLNKYLKQNTFTQSFFFKIQLTPVIKKLLEDFYAIKAYKHLNQPAIEFDEDNIEHLTWHAENLKILKEQLIHMKDVNYHPFWSTDFLQSVNNIKKTPSKPEKYSTGFNRDGSRGNAYIFYKSPTAKGEPAGCDPEKKLRTLELDESLLTLIMKHSAQAEGDIADIHSFYYTLFENLLLTAGVTLANPHKTISITKVDEFCADILLKAVIASYHRKDTTPQREYTVSFDAKCLLEIFVLLRLRSKDNGASCQGRLKHFVYRTIDDQLKAAIDSINEIEPPNDPMEMDTPTTPLAPRQLQF